MPAAPIQATVTRSATTKATTLNAASRQFANRPADERYATLDALLTATRRHARVAVSKPIKLNQCAAVVDHDGALAVRGPQGGIVQPNHWAFGQICGLTATPAHYLRTLPTLLAAECLNNGLKADDGTDRHMLIDVEHRTLRAVNGKAYRRIWNYEVVEQLVQLRERCPSWQFPEPFRTVGGKAANAWGPADGKQVPVAFASDRDMFAFLVDYEHPIEVNGTPLARGFFAENSEVGDASFKLTTFLFDFVCSNILVWGARNVCEIAIRHTGRARDRVLAADSDVIEHLRAYAATPASVQQAQIQKAQTLVLGDDRNDVIGKLFAKLDVSRTSLEAAYTVAEQTPRYGDPSTAWAMANGLTEVSQQAPHADERIKLDRAAGEILDFAF
jgi:hypothetical protein